MSAVDTPLLEKAAVNVKGALAVTVPVALISTSNWTSAPTAELTVFKRLLSSTDVARKLLTILFRRIPGISPVTVVTYGTSGNNPLANVQVKIPESIVQFGLVGFCRPFNVHVISTFVPVEGPLLVNVTV